MKEGEGRILYGAPNGYGMGGKRGERGSHRKTQSVLRQEKKKSIKKDSPY